jgi:hypothetical protein
MKSPDEKKLQKLLALLKPFIFTRLEGYSQPTKDVFFMELAAWAQSQMSYNNDLMGKDKSAIIRGFFRGLKRPDKKTQS